MNEPKKRNVAGINNSNNESDMSNADEKKTTLVVGATGQVGRRVVERLLEENHQVRMLVRNHDKARELFLNHKNNEKKNDLLKVIVCDLGRAGARDDYDTILDQAVDGCGSVISVSGCLRFSKISDFLPWRLFREDVSGWCDDFDHPYFANYRAQCKLIDLAERHSVSRFVRLTGLSVGLSPFNPVSMIFSTLLSLTTRYHFLCEQHLRNSKVPYLILRPGGLDNEDRDVTSTHLQVDASSSSGRVARSDVAALAVAACTDELLLSSDKDYTLRIKAVGSNDEKSSESQGSKENGFATVKECLKYMKDKPDDPMEKTIRSKSYGLAVGILVYSSSIIGIKVMRDLI